MESITLLKSQKQPVRGILSLVSGLSPIHFCGLCLCFLLARGNFFHMLKPLALAFYAASGFTGAFRVLAVLTTGIGNICFSGLFETVRQLFAILMFEGILYIVYKKAKTTVYQRALWMGLAVLVTGLVKGLFQGFHLLDGVSALLTGVLTFSICVLVSPSVRVFGETALKAIPDDAKSLASKALLVGMVILSLEGIAVWGFAISDILSGLTVLIVARKRGSAWGACIGVLMGFVSAMHHLPASVELPGVYALAGAAAGLPVKSRISKALLWFAAVTLFTGLSILGGNFALEYNVMLLSGGVFILFPGRLLNPVSDYLTGTSPIENGDEKECGQPSHEASDKLYILGKALSRISRSIDEYLKDDTDEEPAIAESVIEIVAERVCNRCTQCERCWGSNFLKTYRLVEKAIMDLKSDEAGVLEMPGWFRSVCTKTEKFVESLGVAFSLYKAEKVWHQKLIETRGLVAEQAGLLAGSVMSTARLFSDRAAVDIQLEQRICQMASGMGIPIADVRLYKKDDEKSILDIICDGKTRVNTIGLDEAVNERLGLDMVRVGEFRRDMLGYSIYRYIKQPRFKTITGVARSSRESTSVSGDTFTFFITTEGLHVSVISDGSGSGKKAERYSRTAVQMFECLLEDGVELKLAVRLLKIYLGIRGDHDPLATLDVCTIHMVTGETRFFKFGSPVSLIKRKTGIDRVHKDEMHHDDESHGIGMDSMTRDDLVVMFSDGVQQSFSEDADTTALEKYIDELTTVNPQQMADTILKEAETRAKGLRDDMTVLVTKLW